VNDSTIRILCITAASIGFFHTIIGPDHYLPFIVMSKARNWGLRKTLGLTLICGIGHVLSSVVLGLIGVAIGVALGKLEAFEAMRGGLAAQAMMIFGFTYCIWGVWQAIKNKPHTHKHLHQEEEGASTHEHEHTHTHAHAHVHEPKSTRKALTPWVLFTIFVLGPCEPLIPMLMYPAAKQSIHGTVLVAAVFCLVTVTTMLSVVLVSSWGFRFIKLRSIERFAHAGAGAAILASGLAIQLLGL
jgi:nickel/cobalt exporter